MLESPETTLRATIRSIIEIARLAPSVHNTQPWKVHLDKTSLVITPDQAYLLKDGDPTGREAVISLGIFAETINMVGASLGLSATEMKLVGNEVYITFTSAKPLSSHDTIRGLLEQRVTDRSVYRPVQINPEQIQAIKSAWSSPDATVHVVTDAKHIKQIGDLTAQGIGVALSSPEFRKELSGLLVVPGSKKLRGINVRSLYLPTALAICEPLLMRAGIGIKREVALERKRWHSASGVVCITTPGDMPRYWLAAGRAYLHVALTIEELDLSQATSAATVEASTFHEDIEALLGTTERLQSTIRFGKGATRRAHSPRISSEAILTSN